jgi:hypothetical protein
MDRLQIGDQLFHSSCLRCSHCRTTLTLGNYASSEGSFYCKTHFKQLLPLKGTYEIGSASNLESANWLTASISISRLRGRTDHSRNFSQAGIINSLWLLIRFSVRDSPDMAVTATCQLEGSFVSSNYLESSEFANSWYESNRSSWVPFHFFISSFRGTLAGFISVIICTSGE